MVIMNTKRTLQFITKTVKIQMNHLSISVTGTTITLQLVILCMNNASKILTDTSDETGITRVICILNRQMYLIYTCPKFNSQAQFLLKYNKAQPRTKYTIKINYTA